MASGRFPSVDVAGDPQPTDVPFRITVGVVNEFSAHEPARIWVSFENCSEMAKTVGSGPIFPLSSIRCEEGPIVLVPTDEWIQRYAFGTDEQIIPDRPVDGCWQTNLVRFVRHDVLRWQSLDAGECIETEYTVLQYPEREIMEATVDEWFGPQSESDVCLPEGVYRFEESFLPKFGTEATWDEFAWSFTLTIGE